MSDEVRHLSPGDAIAGKYRVERELAAGGMGVVYIAHHEALNKQVCIKVMAPEWAEHDDAVMRFRREAQAAAQLKSQHVVHIYDVDRLDDGSPFIVMEYLEGRSLDQLLAEHGPLPVALAVDYVIQALRALVEAHAAGIVHRDLKPANLFLEQKRTGGDNIKVLDFGISKLADESGLGSVADDITSSQAVLGTPAYMSPEQAVSARDVDGRTDIWSVGVILYELLTGELIFEGQTMGAVMARILNMPIPPITDKRDDIPVGLGDAVMRCLERDVDERFHTVGELLEALSPFGLEDRVSSHTALMETLPAPAGAAAPRQLSTDMTWRSQGGRKASHRTSLVMLAGAGLIAAAIYFGLRSQAPVPAAPENTPTRSAAPAAASEMGGEASTPPSSVSAASQPTSTPEPSASASTASVATSPKAVPRTPARTAVPHTVAPPTRESPSVDDGAELDKRK